MSSATIVMAPEMAALKTKLKATWESGDYSEFSNYMLDGAVEFLDRLNIPAGTKVLDIGAGAGQLTIPMAKNGIEVTAIDLAQNLVDEARRKAAREGLEIRIEQGDAEDLPFDDASFDVALSFIGAMFAPRPELVAAEMLRVVKPGGKVIMGNWTPSGQVGQMFKVVGKHVPPPPIFPSPVLWGDEATVRERFGAGVSELALTPRMFPFRYPFPPAEVADLFIRLYGPTFRAYRALDEAGQAAFREDLTEVWARYNTATDGTTAVDSEYLEIVGIRK